MSSYEFVRNLSEVMGAGRLLGWDDTLYLPFGDLTVAQLYGWTVGAAGRTRYTRGVSPRATAKLARLQLEQKCWGAPNC